MSSSRPLRPEPVEGRTPTGSARTRAELAAWVVVSLAAYVPLYAVQRRLFTNGLAGDPYAVPRGTADLTQAAGDWRAYWVLITVVLLSYAWLLVRSRHWGRLGRVAVGVTVAGYLVLLFARPALSIDSLTYLSHGFLISDGLNPYRVPAAMVAEMSYGPALTAEGWTAVHGASPYGPLWTPLEQLAYAVGGGQVGTGLLVIKLVVTAATLGSGWLVFRIAGIIVPGAGRTAALAWLANPVVLVELGAEGHNDAVAIFFTLLAFWLALTGRALPAVLALGLGVLTKYTPAVFALALLVLLVQRRRSWSRLLAEVGLAVVVLAGLTWLLWRPWWSGLATFEGLGSTGAVVGAPTPAGALSLVFNDPLAETPSPLPQLILLGVLAAAVLALSWSRDLPRAAAGWAAIALVSLAVLPVYWPWYSALPVAILLLRPSLISFGQVLLLTIGSRFAGPYADAAVLGYVDYGTMFARNPLWGITLPVFGCLVLAVVSISRSRRARAGKLDVGAGYADSRDRT